MTGSHLVALTLLTACGSSASTLTEHAVGTNVGGGSMFGADNCTYAGSPSVLAGASSGAAPGPRFVFAPGTITQTCGDTTTEIKAIVPTGAAITGPGKLKRGSESDLFQGRLVANGRELRGEASMDWRLGKDCAGIAQLAPVLGAQDTGGRDRSRKLVATGAGTCTVILVLTTGAGSHWSFKPQVFQAEKLVTIE
ncbi:MAG: hypothetical protein H0X17_08455 [Deltaproteobacteria bacterium]|nr:hypothetical protein [Deltaproteobacteria bacterium]